MAYDGLFRYKYRLLLRYRIRDPLWQDHSSRFCRHSTKCEKALLQYPPRFIRLKSAPVYLGMDKNLFNRTVRPFLTQIPIGRRGIGFDRLELDQWADQYRACNGRPAPKMERQLWRSEESQGSRSASKPMVRSSGISTNVSKDLDAFPVEFPGFRGHIAQRCFAAVSKSSGLTPPRCL